MGNHWPSKLGASSALSEGGTLPPSDRNTLRSLHCLVHQRWKWERLGKRITSVGYTIGSFLSGDEGRTSPRDLENCQAAVGDPCEKVPDSGDAMVPKTVLPFLCSLFCIISCSDSSDGLQPTCDVPKMSKNCPKFPKCVGLDLEPQFLERAVLWATSWAGFEAAQEKKLLYGTVGFGSESIQTGS